MPALKAGIVRAADQPLTAGKVAEEGGELRIVPGAGHGLAISIMSSRIVPGGGPARHRHPHDEVIVVLEGRAAFDIDGARINAEAGDLVIVPQCAWHVFTNTGSDDLRITAVHDSDRTPTEFEDGRIRD